MTLNQQRKLKTLITGLFAWFIALLLFFPIFWMFITSFKTELQAISVPPSLFLNPHWTTSESFKSAVTTFTTRGTRSLLPLVPLLLH